MELPSHVPCRGFFVQQDAATPRAGVDIGGGWRQMWRMESCAQAARLRLTSCLGVPPGEVSPVVRLAGSRERAAQLGPCHCGLQTQSPLVNEHSPLYEHEAGPEQAPATWRAQQASSSPSSGVIAPAAQQRPAAPHDGAAAAGGYSVNRPADFQYSVRRGSRPPSDPPFDISIPD